MLFAFANKIALPEGLQRALNYVPIAVLSAIIAPAVLMPKGSVDISITNAYLIAAIVAVVVSWYKKNMLLTVVCGLVAFALAKYFIS